MGFFDFFKFTPPPHKKFSLFISNYLTKDVHISECYGEICESGCVDGLKLDYELFCKHYKAIQIQILFSCIALSLSEEKYKNFSNALIEQVIEYDKDIWRLVKHRYHDAYALGGIEAMVEALNIKPFKQKLNSKVKNSLIDGMKIIKMQFDQVIGNF